MAPSTGTSPSTGQACEEVVSRKIRSKKFSTPGALGMDSAALHVAPANHDTRYWSIRLGNLHFSSVKPY